MFIIILNCWRVLEIVCLNWLVSFVIYLCLLLLRLYEDLSSVYFYKRRIFNIDYVSNICWGESVGRKEKDGFVGESERIGNEYGRKE